MKDLNFRDKFKNVIILLLVSYSVSLTIVHVKYNLMNHSPTVKTAYTKNRVMVYEACMKYSTNIDKEQKCMEVFRK